VVLLNLVESPMDFEDVLRPRNAAKEMIRAR